MSEPSSERALARLLAAARRQLVRARTVEALLLALGALAAALLVGALTALAGLRPGFTALGELVVAVAGLIGVGAWAAPRIRAAARSDLLVAGWLDECARDAGGLTEDAHLASAVELLRDRGRFGESAELAEAAARRAVEAASRDGRLEASRERLRAEALRAGAPFLGLTLILGGAYLAEPDSLRGAVAAFGAMDEIDEALERVPPEPRLGDVHLVLRYPAYTGRAPRAFTSPTGRIVALPGTEVEIETLARRPVREASVLVSHGTGDELGDAQRIAVTVEGRTLRTKLVVNRAGRYRFRLTGADGELREERRGHEIELELDEAPEVTLLEPTESPMEVNAKDRVDLAFRARDDFALGEAEVHWRVLGTTREGRVRLTSASSGKKRFAGSAQLDLSTLPLKPGDRVAYTIEVADNDTVSGPKKGTSATQELRIYSERAHHRQVLALQEQSLDELVHILGDNLDFAFETTEDADLFDRLLTAAGRIVERAKKADDLLSNTVAAIRKDPLGRPQVADAFEQARRELMRDTRRKSRAVDRAKRNFLRVKAPQKMTARRVRRSQDRMVRGLEKNVVYLADLINDQRLIDAEALAKELRAEQENLRKALEEYKNAPTDEKRQVIAAAIQDIKRRMQEIMAELAKLQKSIPQDFVNQDALETRDAQAQLDEMQQKLEEGDLDAAMQALDEMLAQTERMMAQLSEGREELGSREYSEVMERAQKLWDDLGDLEQAQEQVAQQTESMSKEVLERMKDRLGDSDAFVKKQLERLEDAKDRLQKARPGPFMPDVDLFELTERRIDDGMRALESKDFGAAKEVLEKADDQMGQLEAEARRRADRARRFGDVFGARDDSQKAERSLQRARPQVEKVLEDIEKLTPSPDSLLSKEERAQMTKLEAKQEGLSKRAEQLEQDLESLGEQLPIVGPQVQGMLQGAQQSMREAKSKLGQGDAPSALSQERTALDKLRQLKQELQKMGEQGQGGSSGGVPLPFGQSPSGGGRDHGQGDPRSQEKVEIPKPDQYKAPAEFREDILEAAKQGTVESYKDAVRRYYEELVK